MHLKKERKFVAWCIEGRRSTSTCLAAHSVIIKKDKNKVTQKAKRCKKKKKSCTKRKRKEKKEGEKKFRSACILFSPCAEILLLVELGPGRV